jgi:hypothetical protein
MIGGNALGLPRFGGHTLRSGRPLLFEVRRAPIAQVECRRRRLYQTSRYSKSAARASSRVRQSAPATSSVLSVAKKLSTTALSQQSPTRLMLACIPQAVSWV